jgi:fructose-bisphosphate aldolase class I
MEGNHTMEECRKTTEDAGRILISVLAEHDVNFEEMLYKVNMILPGKESNEKVKDEEIAKETVETMRRIIPVEVPGVVFLSGGQNEIDATKRLNEINRVKADIPWRLTFSFERALENATMKIWQGKDENILEAQKSLLYRAKMNSLASMGKYDGETNNQ